MVDHTEQKIFIDELTKLDRQRVTVMHEVLHCCTALARVSDDSTEEHTVSALAPVIVQVLRENPDLVAYLTAE